MDKYLKIIVVYICDIQYIQNGNVAKEDLEKQISKSEGLKKVYVFENDY